MLAALLGLAQSTESWYGPAEVTIVQPPTGNPYDPSAMDLRVQFKGPGGSTEERMAFYTGSNIWKARLVARKAGTYQVSVFLNGKAMKSDGIRPVKLSEKLPRGFVRRDPVNSGRFFWSSGEPYYPIGHNLGWQTPTNPKIEDQLGDMGKNGLNWARIWASHWDGKNPWWPIDDPQANLKELWLPALTRWDSIIKAAQGTGVEVQFVLHNHGSYSTKVDANWPQFPWNTANGGWLSNAADFFTDPEAKRRTKMWLRYAVARWAHSPAIFAWELFNEVQWVDARYQDRWNDIVAWHDEMAAYIRSLDPYHHLITTSSELEPKALWKSMDFYQPHTYPSSVWDTIAGAEILKDKPFFFGEYGTANYVEKLERAAVRDGLWASILTNQSGTAQYWYWDRFYKLNLYPEYKQAADILRATRFAAWPGAKPIPLQVEAKGAANLTFGPGAGWQATKVFSLDLPADAKPPVLGGLSAYFQSQSGGNRALFPKPLTLRFTANRPGKVIINLGTIAKRGAHLKASVGGKVVAEADFPESATDHNAAAPFEIPFDQGPVVIVLENTGADWVVLRSITVPAIGSPLRVAAVGDASGVIVRVTKLAEQLDGPFKVAGLPLADGVVSAQRTDLNTGKTTALKVQIRGGMFSVTEMAGSDDVWVLKRVPKVSAARP